ncbi:intercellular adhesion molecule 2-like [Osmerus eperlanus]|uniref:intercellular adhesion molecule 2-like n=1 Tax=Osmerus eperlanus TaxID=29151 RepID=UPI002E1585CF
MSASNLGGIFVLLSFSVFQCFALNDPACAGLMQISPSRLVVRYGDPASALCTITQDPKEPDLFSWEASIGDVRIPGPRNKTLQVDRVDQWDTAPLCYSTFLMKSEELQCKTRLNVTVYQPPDSIRLLAEMTGDMVEGSEYTVNCSVENVAPIQKLKVRFYRGDTLLSTQVHPETTELKPQSAAFRLDVMAREEDDGSEVWCEASLDLENTPVNKSARVRTSVLLDWLPIIAGLVGAVIFVVIDEA